MRQPCQNTLNRNSNGQSNFGWLTSQPDKLTICILQANFPNLRRLFIEARTDNEERDVSRRAVGFALFSCSRGYGLTHHVSSTMPFFFWDLLLCLA